PDGTRLRRWLPRGIDDRQPRPARARVPPADVHVPRGRTAGDRARGRGRMNDYETPKTAMEQAADVARPVFETEVMRLGGVPDPAVIFAWADGLTPSAVSACYSNNDDLADPRGLLAFLITQAQEMAKEIGLTLYLVGGGQG